MGSVDYSSLYSKRRKEELRRSLLQTRQEMHPEVWREKSDRICAHLQAWSGFVEAKTILAYFSIRQEPDLSPLFKTNHRWGFPRCVGKSLVWHVWSSPDIEASCSDPLEPGKYGILEPPSTSPTLDPNDVDLILIPAVACDVLGYRLGYGGGFYDRMLSSSRWATKPTIGIVFEFARLLDLPVDPWDRSLQGTCTEAGLFLSGTLAE